jgi:hypothetical protein
MEGRLKMRKLALALVAGLAAAAVVVLLSGGTAGGQVVPGDHYVCYLAADVTPGGPQNPPPMNIQDQFQPNAAYNPAPADRLCAPAQKNTEPVQDPQTHLKRYPITGPAFTPKTVVVTNQFGQFVIRVTGPRFLLVPSRKSLTAAPPGPNPNAPGFEHYKCYTFNKAPRVTDQFQSVTILAIAWSLCNPASRNGSAIKNPQRHLLCYAVSGPAPNIPNPVFVATQFGQEQLRLNPMRQFCVPSTMQEQPT